MVNMENEDLTLKQLVEQLEGAGYQSPTGPLDNDSAFIELKKIAEADTSNDFVLQEMSIDRQRMDDLKTNRAFPNILRMARYLNQMGFLFYLHETLTRDPKIKEFQFERQMWSTNLLAAGVLHEGLKAYWELSGTVGHLEAYKDGNRRLREHPDLPIVKHFIRKIRNKVAFHLDPDVFKDFLANDKFEENETFLVGTGPQLGLHYYPTADAATYRYVYEAACECCGSPAPPPDEMITKMYGVLTLFNHEASGLIREWALIEAGLEIHDTDG
jgi:hypothetical protein